MKTFQKHVAAEFIGTLLFVFLGGAGIISLSSPPTVPSPLPHQAHGRTTETLFDWQLLSMPNLRVS